MTYKGSFEDLLNKIIENPALIEDYENRDKIIGDAVEMKHWIENHDRECREKEDRD